MLITNNKTQIYIKIIVSDLLRPIFTKCSLGAPDKAGMITASSHLGNCWGPSREYRLYMNTNSVLYM